MKRLLYITHELPYPPRSPEKLRSLRMLEALAERYEVTLASPLTAEDIKHRHDFAERSPCIAQLHRRIPPMHDGAHLAQSFLLRGLPLRVRCFHDAKLAQMIRGEAAGQDIILVDHFEAAAYVPKHFAGTLVYHAPDVERSTSIDRTQRGSAVLRNVARMETLRARRTELTLAQRADLIFASNRDAESLLAAGIDRGKICRTSHLGHDSSLDLPALRFSARKLRVIHVGDAESETQMRGLLWFLESVWPTLLETHPDLEINISCAQPSARLRALADLYPGICLVDAAAAAADFEGARVAVAPILSRENRRGGVVEAMARGIPTVTTPVGAIDVGHLDGHHLAVAKDAGDMASAILELLSDRDLWKRMSSASRELVATRYTWRALFDRMHDAIAETMRTSGASSPGPGLRAPVLSYA
jgi:glycosyltransferase involved in cell wall biosynthesis